MVCWRPGGQPDLETLDEYGVSHRVWKISDPGLVNLVRDKMRDKKLIIADGHHRYETALTYRNQRRAVAPPQERPQENAHRFRTREVKTKRGFRP